MSSYMNTDRHLLNEIVDTLNLSIDDLINKIETLNVSALSEYNSIIHQIRKLIIYYTYAQKYIRILTDSPETMHAVKIKLHLLGVLRAASSFIANDDIVAIHDLLSYELRDNLSLWKIQILSSLRPLQNSSTFGLTPQLIPTASI